MAEQANIQVAQAFFDAWNAHNMSQYDSYEADDLIAEAPGTPGPMTKAQNRMYNEGFLTAFPDGHFELTLTVAQGDYVVMHWTATGTHTGPMATPSGSTIPPTGKSARLTGSSTFEIKNGKLAHAWTFWDMTSLLGQLGLMPAM
jgi:steroid delta-isomerase-like uncharacterized protein